MNVIRSVKANSQYPIQDSRLYKIAGKGQLESLLNIRLEHIGRLLSPDNYRVWINENNREIQQPINWLGTVHKRIGDLLSRIETPEYVYSQKGRSYVDNARQHTGNVPLGKTDISKFYPSTTRQMVWRMFTEDFKCAKDIADILADICCYQQKHLPTGSPLSGRIAFFAARPMFDEIYETAKKTNNKMTLYVDDITLSGQGVTKTLMSDIRKTVRRHGLKTKNSKTKTFAANSSKPITGTVVVGEEVRLPNPRHKKIWETRRALRNATGSEIKRLLKSLNGRLQEAKQVLNPTPQHKLIEEGGVDP